MSGSRELHQDQDGGGAGHAAWLRADWDDEAWCDRCVDDLRGCGTQHHPLHARTGHVSSERQGPPVVRRGGPGSHWRDRSGHPSTHATTRDVDSGSGQLRGRGGHPGLSAIGPSTTTGSPERCNTDRVTEPTIAPCNRPRPRVVMHTRREAIESARRTISSAASSPVTTRTRSVPTSTSRAARHGSKTIDIVFCSGHADGLQLGAETIREHPSGRHRVQGRIGTIQSHGHMLHPKDRRGRARVRGHA